MATVETPREQQKVMVKEMSWDPITRIVGSLGIHTEIDFSNQTVNKCFSTSMVFRGFDIFMKGIDPRDAHFITSRICGICGDNHATCSCLNQNMAYGVKPPPLGDLAFNLAETADYIFDHAIFNDCMANVDWCEQMVKETNPGVLAQGREHARSALRRPRLQDDRRHHAVAEPVHRRVLPGDAPRGPLHAGDVLPVRGPPHAPVHDHARRLQRGHHPPDVHRLLRAADALLRLRQAQRAHARRPVRLLAGRAAGVRHGRLPRDQPGQLGLVRRPRLRRLRLQEHDQLGSQALHHPGYRDRRRADHDRPGRDQPGDSHPAGQLVLRQLGGRADVRDQGSAGQSGGQEPPVEQGHAAQAPEARLHRQVHVGGVAAHPRQRAPARTCAATPAGGRSPASGARPRRGWSTSATPRPPATASRWCCRARPTCRRWSWSGRCPRSPTRSSAIALGPTTRPTRR